MRASEPGLTGSGRQSPDRSSSGAPGCTPAPLPGSCDPGGGSHGDHTIGRDVLNGRTGDRKVQSVGPADIGDQGDESESDRSR